jgi:hypothetical protein
MKLSGFAWAAVLAAAGCVWAQHAGTPAPQKEEKPVMVEGQIVSVDVAGRSLVMKAKVFRVDTFTVDKEVVIRAGKMPRTVQDIKPDIPVQVRYGVENGKKVMKFLSIQPMHSDKPLHPEAPELKIKGADMIVTEGVIQSVDVSGATMIIRAPVERQDTFSVDSAAVIRAGAKQVALGEIRVSSYVNVRYVEEKGRKVVKSIIGRIKKYGSETGNVKKYEVPL